MNGLRLSRATLALQIALGFALGLVLTGCQQKMATEGHFRPESATQVFADGTSAQAPVAGTRPYRPAMESVATGTVPRSGAERLEWLRKGRATFETDCAVCHGFAGYGDGRVVQRGFTAPPSFHEDRLRGAPDSHFLDVIEKGYGAMASYAARVREEDRPALVAYIRALQLSQHASATQLDADDRAKLDSSEREGR